MAGAKFSTALVLSAGLILCTYAGHGLCLTLKIASIAPEGSAWSEAYERFAQKVKELTDGTLIIKHYPGGVMGDEPSLVRKIKIGQLQGAALTELGLGIVLPQTRLFNLIFFYKNFDEWDYIRERLLPEFQKLARKGGFELLGWTEVGPVRFFSKKKLVTFDMFRRAKLWVWAGDPFVKLMVEKGLGASPIVLPLPEVLTGLETGMIDTFYCPAYAALALQWYKEANYVSSIIAGYTSGAIIFSQKDRRKLTKEQAETLSVAWKEVFPWLKNEIRKLNREAYNLFLQKGIEPVKPDDAVLEEIRQRTISLNEQASEMLGAKELYHKIVNLLKSYRSGNTASK